MKRIAVGVVVLMAFSAVGATGIAQEEPPQNPMPSSIDGVRFFDLLVEQQGSPVVMAARYMAWPYRQEKANVWPRGWQDGAYLTAEQVRAQDNEQLDPYGIDVDVIQVNPNQERNLTRLAQNYLPFSERPMFPLYEHHFGTRYRFSPQSPNDRQAIDLDDPYNRAVFLEDIAWLFDNIILPEQHRAVTSNDGRAWVYLWVTQLFVGDIEAVLDEARQRFPVYFVGGSVGALGSPQARASVRALDAIMYYAPGSGTSYGTMVRSYLDRMHTLRALIREQSPETQLFATFVPGFQKAGHPSRIPVSRDEVERFADDIIRAMRDGTFNRGVFTILDEPYEGMAIVDNIRHLTFFLEGRVPLEIVRDHIATADALPRVRWQ